MDNTVRTCARPPQIIRRPRRVPLAPLRGATPTKAALCCRVSVPNAGRSRSNVRAHTGPMPLALCHRSSFSRHRGLPRSSRLEGVVQRGDALIEPRNMGCHVLREASARPREAVLLRGAQMIRCWRRPRRARRSCVWASGSGRGVGRSTSAKWASARASNAAVVANWPVARAKSRAGRGLTTTTGRPAVANAAVPRAPGPRWLPAPSGWGERLHPFHERHDAPRIVGDSPSLAGGAHRNIPRGFGDINPDKTRHVNPRTPLCPTLQRRAQWHQTPVRACGA